MSSVDELDGVARASVISMIDKLEELFFDNILEDAPASYQFVVCRRLFTLSLCVEDIHACRERFARISASPGLPDDLMAELDAWITLGSPERNQSHLRMSGTEFRDFLTEFESDDVVTNTVSSFIGLAP